MSIFPIITHIDDLKPHVEHLPEVRFSKQPNGLTVVCVMIADNTTYSGPEAMWVRECRGITFYEDGTLAVRSLHKFFNVGERTDTQEGILPWHSVTRIMAKMDGSVINPVLVDGQVVFKSKKTFTSDVAILASNTATLNDKLLSEWCLLHGLSPTFELTSPKARVVIKYPNSRLTLLHIRDNVSGRYLSAIEVNAIADKFDLEVVRNFGWTMKWSDIKEELLTIENFEGYCIQFVDGEIVKAKSKWYRDRHHALTALTERNVAEMVVNECLDDLKSTINDIQDEELIARVEEIETTILRKVNLIAKVVETQYEEDKHLSRKDFAMKYSKQRNFGLLMTRFLGEKEPDYLGHYAKYYLKDDWEVSTLSKF